MLAATNMTVMRKEMEGRRKPVRRLLLTRSALAHEDAEGRNRAFFLVPVSTDARPRPDRERSAARPEDTAHEGRWRSLSRPIHLGGYDIAGRNVGIQISGKH